MSRRRPRARCSSRALSMKLGAYGALRIAMNLFPLGYESWRNWIVSLGSDRNRLCRGRRAPPKRSQIRHWLFERQPHGISFSSGWLRATLSVFPARSCKMFSHGVIGALLFALAGAVYYRTHTRDLDDLATMQLGRRMPFLAFAFVVASAASLGIPGFSGFAAEITILPAPGRLFRRRFGSRASAWCWWRPLPCGP